MVQLLRILSEGISDLLFINESQIHMTSLVVCTQGPKASQLGTNEVQWHGRRVLDEDFNYFRDGGAQREPKETHRTPQTSLVARARVTFVITLCCVVLCGRRPLLITAAEYSQQRVLHLLSSVWYIFSHLSNFLIEDGWRWFMTKCAAITAYALRSRRDETRFFTSSFFLCFKSGA